MKYKLVRIIQSPIKTKKYRAVWSDDTHTDFGASGYEDYTTHKDKSRRENYRSRHRNDILNNAKSPGALSWYILWGNSTSMQQNISQFKNKFNV